MSGAVLQVVWDVGGITASVVHGDGEVLARLEVDPAAVAAECARAVDAGGVPVEAVELSAMPGLVAVGADGSPVATVVGDHPDTSPDAGWLTDRLPGKASDWQAAVGAAPAADWLLAKLSWLHRSDADAWAGMSLALTPLAWLALALGGAAATDAADAAATGAWADGSYRGDLLAIVDADLPWDGMLPAVVAEGGSLGTWRGIPIRCGGPGRPR